MHMYSAKFLTREPKPDRVLVLNSHSWVHCVALGPAGRDALPVSGGALGRENAPLMQLGPSQQQKLRALFI